jgi:hypothetical protein
MYAKITLSTILCATALFAAATKTVSLHIPDEMAPPGGMVQMKLMVTEPTPIATGSVGFSFDAGTFAGVEGISLFNPAGDVSGAAVVQGNHVQLRYSSTTGTSGTDYPIMSFAIAVRPDALPGQKTQFSLDASSVWLLDLFGWASLKPVPPANITVGGSISITNITPGAGVMPAGSVLKIHGIGFQPKTQVQASGMKLSSINLVSSEEIDLTIAEAVLVTGKKIQVVNPDGSQDSYFSYMRGVALGSSTQPLLAATYPVFSSQTHSQATLLNLPTVDGQFNGLALQNPNGEAVTITLESHGLFGNLVEATTIVLPSAMKITRDILEWLPSSRRAAYVRVISSAPIQLFGIWGDTATNTVLPFRPLLATP